MDDKNCASCIDFSLDINKNEYYLKYEILSEEEIKKI